MSARVNGVNGNVSGRRVHATLTMLTERLNHAVTHRSRCSRVAAFTFSPHSLNGGNVSGRARRRKRGFARPTEGLFLASSQTGFVPGKYPSKDESLHPSGVSSDVGSHARLEVGVS